MLIFIALFQLKLPQNQDAFASPLQTGQSPISSFVERAGLSLRVLA